MIGTPNTYSNLLGTYFPKVKTGALNFPGGANPAEQEVILEGRRWVYLGKLVLEVDLGVTLHQVRLLFHNTPTHSQPEPSLLLASEDLLPAASQSGSVYTLSADTFTSGGNLELSFTGFVVRASSPTAAQVRYKVFYAVPVIYFAAS